MPILIFRRESPPRSGTSNSATDRQVCKFERTNPLPRSDGLPAASPRQNRNLVDGVNCHRDRPANARKAENPSRESHHPRDGFRPRFFLFRSCASACGLNVRSAFSSSSDLPLRPLASTCDRKTCKPAGRRAPSRLEHVRGSRRPAAEIFGAVPAPLKRTAGIGPRGGSSRLRYPEGRNASPPTVHGSAWNHDPGRVRVRTPPK